MIRTDSEYAQARTRLRDRKRRLADHAASMAAAGLEAPQLKRAIDPIHSATLQLEEEVQAYERARRGSFEPITNLASLGELLVAARIFSGISQRELAKRLGVHESQVSRDERNEYRTITIDRATRILEAIGVAELRSELRLRSPREMNRTKRR